MHTKLPFKIFICLFLAFFIAQRIFNVIAHHYTWVHFYFGVSAPLFVGYFPYTLFQWNGWSQLLVNRKWSFGWRWSLLAGVIGTFLASFINEVIDDPKQNGIPFLKAWHHFAADMAGIAMFALVYFVVFRHLFSRPNPLLNSDSQTSCAPVS